MTPVAGTLRRRRLGNSGLCVSALGLGAAPLGGMYQPCSDTAAAQTVRAALEAGITLFDVAPHYGQGLAERRLGHGLAQLRSGGYVVSTKVGRLLHPAPRPPASAMWPEALAFTTVYDVSRAGILRSLRDSRERVGRATFEILLLHDPDRYADGPDTLRRLIAEAYATLSALRQEGRVRAIGIGANSPAVGLAALELGRWDCFLLAGSYSVLGQEDRGLLDRCAGSAVSVLIGGPYMSGALAGGTTWRYRPIPAGIGARIARLGALCRDHGIPPQAAALQFPLLHPAVASVIVGMRSADEVGQNVAFLRHPIPDRFWDSLLAEGFIAEPRSPARGLTS
jgi:D-threo-aldose 1-dehydrogenase